MLDWEVDFMPLYNVYNHSLGTSDSGKTNFVYRKYDLVREDDQLLPMGHNRALALRVEGDELTCLFNLSQGDLSKVISQVPVRERQLHVDLESFRAGGVKKLTIERQNADTYLFWRDEMGVEHQIIRFDTPPEDASSARKK